MPATWPAELTFDATGAFSHANAEWFDLTGIEPGSEWTNAFVPGDALIAKAVAAGALTGIHMAPVRLRLSQRDHTLECLFQTPEAATEHVTASARLLGKHSNDQYLHDVLESTTEGIASVERDREGVFRVVHANGRFCELMSMPRHELLGRTLDHFLRTDADVILSAFIEAEARNEPAYRERFRSRGGQRRKLQATFSPGVEREGGRRHFTAVLRDVTATGDDQLRAAAQQRQESLDIMASGIAHELNNSLVAIIGNLDLSLDERAVPPTVREYVQAARDSSMRAAELGKMLLASTGHSQVVLELVNINEVIASRWSTFESIAGPNIDVRYSPGEDLPGVLADGSQLAHCLVAVITNAAEAVEGRPGVIEVSTQRVHLDQRGAGRLGITPGEYLSVSIRDDGSGIMASNLERVFEPFFSTRFLGRGMGLPSVRGIMRAHGGAIALETELSVGTTATMYLRVVSG